VIGGLQVPGPSPLHALPAGAKLLALAGLGTAAFAADGLLVLGLGAGAIAALYPLGRVPLRRVWAQTRDLAVLLGLMAAAQAYFDGPATAAETVLRVLGMVWAAGLVTATTPFSEMMATVQRLLTPLKPFGVAPKRLAFALTLAVRFVPLLQDMMAETRAAQAARGLGRNPLALAVPITIRTLRMADTVAESLDARDALAEPEER
jgi:biotin transport system permease protein